jgi:uncharacterized Fe-S cluster-containing protein
MKDTITYRPTIEPEKLSKIIKKLHYPKVNRFIDDAVREKIKREATHPKAAKAEAMLWEIKEVLDKYKGTKFLKPSPELAREIDAKADAIMKNRNKRARASA